MRISQQTIIPKQIIGHFWEAYNDLWKTIKIQWWKNLSHPCSKFQKEGEIGNLLVLISLPALLWISTIKLWWIHTFKYVNITTRISPNFNLIHRIVVLFEATKLLIKTSFKIEIFLLQYYMYFHLNHMSSCEKISFIFFCKWNSFLVRN